MPYSKPRDVRGYVEELRGEVKMLRRRASTFRAMNTRTRINNKPRPDLAEVRERIARVLCDAADLIENRIFVEF